MATLFTLSDGQVQTLSPTLFHKTHVEEDLQRWADGNPHLLNEGTPMLSLGMEIVTHRGYSIDNLFLDGNGCLVVAELKRGLTPRDVTAQVIDYAAHVSHLGWPDVDALCRKRHGGTDLDTAFRRCFGRPLMRTEKIDLRLLIVAESYDASVSDAALFLINSGTPLALLQFTYFEVGDSKLFEVRTVLGEIPEQAGRGAEAATPDEGYNNWLFSSVAEKLPEIERSLGCRLQFRVNKQSLPIVSGAWPTVFGDCQLRLDTYKKGVLAFSLSARKDVTPGLREFLGARRDDWREGFPAEFTSPPHETPISNLTYSLPTPKMGDADALADVVERTERMAQAMVPLLDEYFERRETGDT